MSTGREIEYKGASAHGFGTYRKNSRVGALVSLNRSKLFNGDLRVGEASRGEVGLLELGQCLGVELGLELLKDMGERWVKVRFGS